MDKEKPYIEEEKITILIKYNPKYGDARVCLCGHPYYRHFDTYEDMEPCGCKYCQCYTFKEENPYDWREVSFRPLESGYCETRCGEEPTGERFYNRKTDIWGTRICWQQPTHWRPINKEK